MESTMTLPVGAPVKPKMKKATVVALAGGAVVLVGGFFVFVYKDKNDKTLWSKWTNKDQTKDEAEQKEEEKMPDATPVPVKSGFPLNANEKNTNVKTLQQALIKMGFKISGAPSDYLGANTLKALKDAGYNVPLLKQDFDSIIAGKKFCLNRPKLSSDKWVQGRPLYAVIQRVVKANPDNNSNTLVNVPKCGIAGTYKGKSNVSGWSKVNIYVPSKGQSLDGYIATGAVTQFSDGV